MDTEQVKNFFLTQGVNLLRGVAVLVIGLFLVRWVSKLLARKERFKHIDPTLTNFLGNLLRLLMYGVVVLTAASVMGIPLTSVVTLVASAGVAVSLAMQGALSNLVGGVSLLLLKPIKVDEYIKVGDYDGTVKSIGAFYTVLSTPDNRQITMPNSSLTNTAIVNYTRLGTRRIDVTYSLGYETDMEKAFAALSGLIAARKEILADPAPAVHLNAMGDSALVFVARVWCKTADYWDIYFYLLEEGKRAIDRAGLQIPYPQMDVHIKQ
ncbi:MAG: mechanosensitive ion channel [Clostridia bacterium]|nr:mechanosensitive ion channel [Clostridia bacterium]